MNVIAPPHPTPPLAETWGPEGTNIDAHIHVYYICISHMYITYVYIYIMYIYIYIMYIYIYMHIRMCVCAMCININYILFIHHTYIQIYIYIYVIIYICEIYHFDLANESLPLLSCIRAFSNFLLHPLQFLRNSAWFHNFFAAKSLQFHHLKHKQVFWMIHDDSFMMIHRTKVFFSQAEVLDAAIYLLIPWYIY